MAKTSYIISKRIARGGMAEIFLGKAVGDNAFQRICAIKRILPHYAQDKEFVEMFRDEAHICKRLQQANIVQVYDFTEVEGSFALIMEHIDGADLRTLLAACEAARVRMSVSMVVYMGASILRGLHYAHTKIDEITNLPLGIVHRDVSPQNILISYEGEVKITDFGIAESDDKIAETRPGVVKGKYSYMSPEQVAAKTLDGRSDVFSLAVVMWECLTMKRLFTGQTEVETIRKVQNCEIPQKLTELNPEVDETLNEIIERGLAKDRKRRYQTAASFERALLKYLHSRYPEFTPSEFGNFLKQILAKRREESASTIKEVLTATRLPNPLGGSSVALPQDEKSKENYLSGGQEKAELHTVIENIGIKPLGEATKLKKLPQAQTHNQTSHHSRRYAPRPKHFSKPKHQRRKMIIVGALTLGLIGLGFVFYSGDVSSDDKLHIELKSSPDLVLLSINGAKINKGFYTKTPLKLHLKPGVYQLHVSRNGYQPKTIDFQGKAGDSLNLPPIFLDAKSAAQLASVRFVSRSQNFFINLDQGLAKGVTPLVVNGIETEINHVVAFRSEGKEEKNVRCVFKVPSVKGGAFVVTLDLLPKAKPQCSVGQEK